MGRHCCTLADVLVYLKAICVSKYRVLYAVWDNRLQDSSLTTWEASLLFLWLSKYDKHTKYAFLPFLCISWICKTTLNLAKVKTWEIYSLLCNSNTQEKESEFDMYKIHYSITFNVLDRTWGSCKFSSRILVSHPDIFVGRLPFLMHDVVDWFAALHVYGLFGSMRVVFWFHTLVPMMNAAGERFMPTVNLLSS